MSFIEKIQKFSVLQIFESIKVSAKRFPAVVLAILLSSGLAYYLIEVDVAREIDLAVQQKTLMLTVLAIPLFTVLTLLAEKHHDQKYLWGALHVVGLLALVLYYFFLPERPADFSEVHVKRYAFLQIISYVLLFSISHWDSDKSKRLWQYGYHIFLRLLTTALFSLVILIGLSLAFWSIDYLFNMDFSEKVFLRIWVFVASLFAPLYFLGGVPKDVKQFEKKEEYPTLFRVLTQFILVPLLSFFFVILYIYLGKIVFTWDWPLGGTGYWVITYCGFAVFTFVLAYPLKLQEAFAWLRKFLTGLFVLTIPLAIVLFMAIGIRIYHYGWTENRYMVVLLGIWLVFVSLYYLLSKTKALRIIPISFVLFIFFTMWGPWGMFAVGMHSQLDRLETLLVENNVLVNGKIVTIESNHPLNNEDGYETLSEIHSKFTYIVYHDGAKHIEGWFPETLYAPAKGKGMIQDREYSRYDILQNVEDQVGLESYYLKGPTRSNQNRTSFHAVRNDGIKKVKPFEYVWEVGWISGMKEGTASMKKVQEFDDGKLEIELIGEFLRITHNDSSPVIMKMEEFYNNLRKNTKNVGDVPSEMMYLEAENENLMVGVQFDFVYFNRDNGKNKSINAELRVYFTPKGNE